MELGAGWIDCVGNLWVNFLIQDHVELVAIYLANSFLYIISFYLCHFPFVQFLDSRIVQNVYYRKGGFHAFLVREEPTNFMRRGILS